MVGSLLALTRWPAYSDGMRTIISLPGDLFHAAARLARKLGVTRKQLFQIAVTEYVARHRSSWVTERLNSVYAPEVVRLEPALRRAQRQIVNRSDW